MLALYKWGPSSTAVPAGVQPGKGGESARPGIESSCVFSRRKWDRIRTGLQNGEKLMQAVVAAGKTADEELPADIEERLLELFKHPDPEIRVEAVRSVGSRWRCPRALPSCMQVFDRDEDPYVQLAAIAALGALAADNIALQPQVARRLAEVVMDQQRDEYMRQTAYIELLRVAGRITFQDYINQSLSLPETLDEMQVDQEFLERIAGPSRCQGL